MSVGTQIVISVVATTVITHATVAPVLSLEEPTTWSADRYVGDGRYSTMPAMSAAIRPPFRAALVTRDSPFSF